MSKSDDYYIGTIIENEKQSSLLSAAQMPLETTVKSLDLNLNDTSKSLGNTDNQQACNANLSVQSQQLINENEVKPSEVLLPTIDDLLSKLKRFYPTLTSVEMSRMLDLTNGQEFAESACSNAILDSDSPDMGNVFSEETQNSDANLMSSQSTDSSSSVIVSNDSDRLSDYMPNINGLQENAPTSDTNISGTENGGANQLNLNESNEENNDCGAGANTADDVNDENDDTEKELNLTLTNRKSELGN